MNDEPSSDLLKCLDHIIMARVALDLAFMTRDDGVIEAGGYGSLGKPVSTALQSAHANLVHLCDTIGRADPDRAYLIDSTHPT